MKYSILSPDTEKVLGEVDHLESSAGTQWRFAGKLIEPDPRIRGDRAAESVVQFATPLGTVALSVRRGAAAAAGASAGGARHRSVKSTIPGRVSQILCKKGDRVQAGQPLLILEAMKMENEIRAPYEGTVEDVPVQVGKKVEKGELLVMMGAEPGNG